MVVAGGRGERMRPATDAVPKPMLPLGGKPLLEHQLRWHKSSGFKEAFLCLGYKASAIQDRFADGSSLGITLSYQVEKTPRGTAGAVRDLGLRGDLLVVYGDLYVDMDCGRLLDFHARHEGAATLVLRETDHPYDSDLARVEGERIAGFYRAKTGEPTDRLGLAAVWVTRPSLMELVPGDRPSDFGRDIFPKALAEGLALWGFRTAETVVDLGTPERCRDFARRWKHA